MQNRIELSYFLPNYSLNYSLQNQSEDQIVTEIMPTLLEALQEKDENKFYQLYDHYIRHLSENAFASIETILSEEKYAQEKKHFLKFCEPQTDIEKIEQLLSQIKNKIAELSSQILDEDGLANKIIKILLNSPSEPKHAAKALDLYFTLNSIYRIVSSYSEDEEIKKQIIDFFALREKVLHGDMNDYCMSLSSANYICAALTDLIFPNSASPLTHLLKNTLTENRPEPWLDYISLSKDLPAKPGDFFRSENNRIQLYNVIVDQIIIQLKNKYTQINDVIKSVDRYPNEALELSANDIYLLRQRSKTLSTLVEYIERLSAQANENLSTFERFTRLRAALLKGDAGHTGTEYDAGSAANIAIAKFSEWWTSLAQTDNGKELQTRICAINEGNLGTVINTVLDVSVTDRANPNYCIALKGQMLEVAITTDQAKSAFSEIDDEIEWIVSDETLDQWAGEIENELEEMAPNIVNSKNIFKALAENDKFIDNCLQDDTVNYETLFVNANASILWFKREQDDGKASFLYEAVKKKNNKAFTHFLLSYHAHHYSERALGNILILLYKSHNLELINLLIAKSPYPLTEVIDQLFHSELDNAKPNTEILKTLYRSKNEKQSYLLLELLNKKIENQELSTALTIADIVEIDSIHSEEVEFMLEILLVTEWFGKYEILKTLLNNTPGLIHHPHMIEFFNSYIRNPGFYDQSLEQVSDLVIQFAKNERLLKSEVFPNVSYIVNAVTLIARPKLDAFITDLMNDISDEDASIILLHLCNFKMYEVAKKILNSKINLTHEVTLSFEEDYIDKQLEESKIGIQSRYNSFWLKQYRIPGGITFDTASYYDLNDKKNKLTSFHFALLCQERDNELINLFISHPSFKSLITRHNELLVISIEIKLFDVFKKLFDEYFDVFNLEILYEAIKALIAKEQFEFAKEVLIKLKSTERFQIKDIEDSEIYTKLLTSLEDLEKIDIEVLKLLSSKNSVKELLSKHTIIEIRKKRPKYFDYLLENSEFLEQDDLISILMTFAAEEDYTNLRYVFSFRKNLFENRVTEASKLLEELNNSFLPKVFLTELALFLPIEAIINLFDDIHKNSLLTNLRLIELYADQLDALHILPVLKYLANMQMVTYIDNILHTTKADLALLLSITENDEGKNPILINAITRKSNATKKRKYPTEEQELLSNTLTPHSPKHDVTDTMDVTNNNDADINLEKLKEKISNFLDDQEEFTADEALLSDQELNNLQSQQLSLKYQLDNFDVSNDPYRFFPNQSKIQKLRNLIQSSVKWSRLLCNIAFTVKQSLDNNQTVDLGQLHKLATLCDSHFKIMQAVNVYDKQYYIDYICAPPRKKHCIH